MKKRGGLGPKRKGDAFEAAVVKDWERRPNCVAFRARQGGGEIVDVVALERCNDVGYACSRYRKGTHGFLIQCRVGGKMSAIEREQLIERAGLVDAHPLLAVKDGDAIAYVEVKR